MNSGSGLRHKTLREPVRVVVVLPDMKCPQIRVFRRGTGYISAALSIGWDLTAGRLFPVVEPTGERARAPPPAPPHSMTADHVTMRSCRVKGSHSRSLAGTAVDEIMEITDWKTKQVPRDCMVATKSSAPAVVSK